MQYLAVSVGIRALCIFIHFGVPVFFGVHFSTWTGFGLHNGCMPAEHFGLAAVMHACILHFATSHDVDKRLADFRPECLTLEGYE